MHLKQLWEICVWDLQILPTSLLLLLSLLLLFTIKCSPLITAIANTYKQNGIGLEVNSRCWLPLTFSPQLKDCSYAVISDIKMKALVALWGTRVRWGWGRRRAHKCKAHRIEADWLTEGGRKKYWTTVIMSVLNKKNRLTSKYPWIAAVQQSHQ